MKVVKRGSWWVDCWVAALAVRRAGPKAAQSAECLGLRRVVSLVDSTAGSWDSCLVAVKAARLELRWADWTVLCLVDVLEWPTAVQWEDCSAELWVILKVASTDVH